MGEFVLSVQKPVGAYDRVEAAYCGAEGDTNARRKFRRNNDTAFFKRPVHGEKAVVKNGRGKERHVSRGEIRVWREINIRHLPCDANRKIFAKGKAREGPDAAFTRAGPLPLASKIGPEG